MSAGLSIDRIAAWVADQRWYASKGRRPELEVRGAWSLHPGEAEVVDHLFIDRAGTSPVLYQVPVTVHAAPVPGLEDALVYSDDSHYVYDAPRDPVFARALLGMIADGGRSDEDGAQGGARAEGHRQPGAAIGAFASSKVLSGEQSNTSVIVRTTADDGSDATPVIVKVFRALHHGDNPDVTVQSALNAAGSALVPPVIGNVTGEWDDEGEETGRAFGHLAFAQEFLPGVQDAWRVALEAVAADSDFTGPARELGRATAEVHATLAEVMPTEDTTSEVVERMVAAMRRRLRIASAEVPVIAEDSEAIEAVFRAAETAPWPRLQRIHGDYHLGQVLSVPDRGWVLLDFEGEPLRPMHERRLPDVALRDVAGMLRSFDYAAGAHEQAEPGASRAAWAAASRAAFLEGYAEQAGDAVTAHRAVLDAFELDKAVYEAIYEARNRPEWLSIPVAAVQRLAGRS
ncbi:phosphotransferase [Rathayibacter sp. AY1F6]|jgi:predicted trehalose synthase|uniref:maltokinase N-terminal cap-like domain-containing protein n=1 Tax=unclassified Rathayibacter TaxID=2609250 RepID=UPI000CE8D996|nr:MULTISPECIES: phosphotransferase [unclassified Rathayibacter]PPF12872.1 phosphotransferase [Rathayibacter sp. AY1A5]PPF49036.1 phosphotransferase [Rathayibacter sp. AY1A1]PPH00226.1 phosphotransferase [Rathayibacter sp. AY1G9]PPH06147.1 phosphotransferase [Rathayibacter sp. AY1F6]PPH21261.1 phosphotransferase [Rathayibacter sp. AY1C4]